MEVTSGSFESFLACYALSDAWPCKSLQSNGGLTGVHVNNTEADST
jgi:hypothetical protein